MTLDIGIAMFAALVQDKNKLSPRLVHRRPMTGQDSTLQRRIIPSYLIRRDKVITSQVVQDLFIQPVKNGSREFLRQGKARGFYFLVFCIHGDINGIMVLMPV